MSKPVFVREVLIEDRREIWEWWNDPVTRKMMKKNDNVPWEVHCKWFDEALKDKNRILTIGIFEDMKIGNTRFDYQSEGIYEVSINVNPEVRGKGLGTSLLGESIRYIRGLKAIRKIFATLKKSNIASKRAFEKAGFIFTDALNFDYPGLKDYISEDEYYCEIIY